VKRRTGHSPSVIDTLLAATAIENELFSGDAQYKGRAA